MVSEGSFRQIGLGCAAMLAGVAIKLPALANPTSSLVAQVPQANLLYVNSLVGSDGAPGTAQAPLRTITQALNVAAAGTTIVLAPGTYSNGEAFPIRLKPGVTIQGDPRDRGQSIIIRGGDVFLSRSFARQNVTIVGANQAGLVGVTVTNPNPQGYGLWIESTNPTITDNTFTGSGHDGASIVGSSAAVFRNNYFYQNGANGITIYGTSRPDLEENIFERTGFGINIAQNAMPKLIGNRITQNKDGIVVQGRAQPILRNNVIDSNDRDGMVTIAQSRPDLGTSTDPGNNTFLRNGQFDINARKSIETVPAFGNQISAKIAGRVDSSGVVDRSTSVASSRRFMQSATPREMLPQSSLLMRESTSFPPAAASQASTGNSLGSMNLIAPIAVAPRSSRVGRALPQPKAPVAVTIPVSAATSAPLPRLNRVSPVSRSTTPLLFRATSPVRATEAAIEIPVPAPESGESVAFNPAPVRVTQTPRLSSARSPGLLPVPRKLPPVGNTSGLSSVWRGSGGRSTGTFSQSSSAGLRFRVVVDAGSESEQAQLRSTVPDAFWVTSRGRNVLQAGAFGERSKADELLQTLINQGLRATIEQL